MNIDDFNKMLKMLDLDEVAEVVRLQNEMTQAADMIEFLIQGAPMDAYTLKTEVDAFKIAHNNFKDYILKLFNKYCAN